MYKSLSNLHGVVRDEENILDGEGEYVGCEEAGEEETHGQLVVSEVTIGTDKQSVTEIFVGQKFLHHRVLRLQVGGVHHAVNI